MNNDENTMQRCNILENKVVGNGTAGLISATGRTLITECTILKNQDRVIFKADAWNAVMAISNCTIGEEDVNKTGGNIVKIDSWTPTPSTFINAIIGVETLLCKGQYDVIGTLKPNILKKSTPKIPIIYTLKVKPGYFLCSLLEFCHQDSFWFSHD